MGLFLRCNLFYGADHQQVYEALAEFWHDAHHRLEPADAPGRDVYVLHERRGWWTALEWTIGWEWELRRGAQFHVSRSCACPGLLTFVYDGDYWGYELFDRGEAVDQFLQTGEPGTWFAPDRSVLGRPDLLVDLFPDLRLDPAHAQGYLNSKTLDELYPDNPPPGWDPDDQANRPVRPGDDWGDRDAQVIFDFWRFLGVAVSRTSTTEWFDAPVWRRFSTVPD